MRQAPWNGQHGFAKAPAARQHLALYFEVHLNQLHMNCQTERLVEKRIDIPGYADRIDWDVSERLPRCESVGAKARLTRGRLVPRQNRV
jgi:hypothetical protein